MNGVKLNHWFFWSLLALSLFCIGMAQGQTVPKYVATVAGTGMIQVFDTAYDDNTNITGIQVYAATNMRFSFWSADGSGNPVKIFPVFGK